MKTEMLEMLVGIISVATVTPLSSLLRSTSEGASTERARVLQRIGEFSDREFADIGIRDEIRLLAETAAELGVSE